MLTRDDIVLIVFADNASYRNIIEAKSATALMKFHFGGGVRNIFAYSTKIGKTF